MKIKYRDLAWIIQSIRDSGDFDGLDDINEFMDRLDEMWNEELTVNEFKGTIIYKIHND